MSDNMKQTEKILGQYTKKGPTKFDELRALDKKVKKPGTVFASIIGTVGTLLLGSGMALIMEMDKMQLGLALGIPGLIVALLAYPVYTLITNRRKKKYAEKIKNLGDEIMEG